MRRIACATISIFALALGLTGCKVQVDKDEKGQEKTVKVDTPFGGVHVDTDRTTAPDLGLPVYPGAKAVADGDDQHKSADVNVGFGEWRLRVRTVSYESSDAREKIVPFYKKALAVYGEVLACQDKAPIGKPTQTSGGLTCEEKSESKGKFESGDMRITFDGFQLKAGSPRHQHIVSFKDGSKGVTRFEMVALDLPSKSDKKQPAQSN